MTLLTFIILSLAVFRVTHLIVFDKIFEAVRKHFVIRDFKTRSYTLQGGSIRRAIGSIINCYWCAGIWVSALIIGCYLLSPNITFYACLIFALSSVQVLIETGVLKSVGMPLEMVEVKAELEEDELSTARGIKDAIILSLVFYTAVISIGLILMKCLGFFQE